ncbi:type II secretion system F family protein [Candidatus Woesearchaeota archaeon]|nr:type II secretion system F family protein [Candidatus Woesearchaeota archaeon]
MPNTRKKDNPASKDAGQKAIGNRPQDKLQQHLKDNDNAPGKEPKKLQLENISNIFRKPSKKTDKREEESLKEKDENIEKEIKKEIKNIKRKEKKEKKSLAARRRWLSEHIEKAGFDIPVSKVNKLIFYAGLIIVFLLTIPLVIISIRNAQSVVGIIIQTLLLWSLGFAVAVAILHVAFRSFIDIKVFQRKLSVEEVLPDFLQLTSANIRAGMPIDRALWMAVRPRFGVLAKEIENVAKCTLSGEDLHKSLINFANKYDSIILLRSVHLLNEGIEAGGDIGDLLNKIANNIQELRTMKKEMAANVTTYVIFISFAAIVAAPFLFGLSHELLNIVQGIATNVAESSGPQGMPSGGIGISMNIDSDNIKISDYQIFAYTCLITSAFFSSIIVSTITKGNVKEGLQYIPVFVGVVVIIYYIAIKALGLMLGGLV